MWFHCSLDICFVPLQHQPNRASIAKRLIEEHRDADRMERLEEENKRLKKENDNLRDMLITGMYYSLLCCIVCTV